jgi:hypothetical protein
MSWNGWDYNRPEPSQTAARVTGSTRSRSRVGGSKSFTKAFSTGMGGWPPFRSVLAPVEPRPGTGAQNGIVEKARSLEVVRIIQDHGSVLVQKK